MRFGDGEGDSRWPNLEKFQKIESKVYVRIGSMQNTKLCPRCRTSKHTGAFARRAASKDGLAPACKACINIKNLVTYLNKPEVREATRSRVVKNRVGRFKRDPAYKRAFYLWGTTKRRTKIPPWVSIVDFVPICQAAIDAGPGHELDHEIPLRGKLVSGLHVPGNLRVVTPKQNQDKANKFDL